MVYTIKYLALISIVAFLAGCRLEVVAVTGGDVQSGSGTRNCAEGNTCSFEINDSAFAETFTALARPGYEFVRWQTGRGFVCEDAAAPTCVVSMPPEPMAANIVASLAVGFVMPLYRDIGVDTDGDGIPDALDDDDDNDGVLDADDQCRLTGPNDDGFGCPFGESPPAGACVNSATVECDYNVSNEEWHATARTTVRIRIPGGKTLISSFTTSSSPSADFGRFSFTTAPIDIPESVDVWVSESVMGNAVSSRCYLDSVAYTYQIRTTTYSSFYCELNPNQTYYLHIRHIDPAVGGSYMYRELTTN